MRKSPAWLHTTLYHVLTSELLHSSSLVGTSDFFLNRGGGGGWSLFSKPTETLPRKHWCLASRVKAILPSRDGFGEKNRFFFPGFDLRAPVKFSHEIFFKPTLQIEICSFRMFLWFHDHENVVWSCHQVGDLEKRGFQNGKSLVLGRICIENRVETGVKSVLLKPKRFWKHIMSTLWTPGKWFVNDLWCLIISKQLISKTEIWVVMAGQDSFNACQ